MKSPVKQKEIIRALEKIGFQMISGSKHLKYVYIHSNGKPLATVMLTKSRNEIPRGTLSKIRGQTHLDRESFNGALKCPFGHEQFVDFIDRKGLAE